MRPVSVSILHPAARDDAGPLERWVADARGRLARHHVAAFDAAGATSAVVVTGVPDGSSFGARLRPLIAAAGSGGIVVLGSGAMPLSTAADHVAFVSAAAGEAPRALANNRYSADAIAIARADLLPAVPDLPGDNALPRWLEEIAGVPIDDRRTSSRLAFDIDTPLDLVLLDVETDGTVDVGRIRAALADVRTVARDRRAELLVAGRTSATTLRWLEAHTAARVRAWVEERGLRAASRLALDENRDTTQRPPASVLGALLDRDGPGSIGRHLVRFADAAIVDTRVLLAHRLGADESAWPAAEDRFASDLLLPRCISDPWLQELTTAAAEAPVPILLGGHSLVGPGIRYVVDGPPRTVPWR